MGCNKTCQPHQVLSISNPTNCEDSFIKLKSEKFSHATLNDEIFSLFSQKDFNSK